MTTPDFTNPYLELSALRVIVENLLALLDHGNPGLLGAVGTLTAAEPAIADDVMADSGEGLTVTRAEAADRAVQIIAVLRRRIAARTQH